MCKLDASLLGEHKKNPEASANSSELPRVLWRWKTMSVMDKGKVQGMAKVNKVHYERNENLDPS